MLYMSLQSSDNLRAAYRLDDLPAVRVCEGIERRDFPPTDFARSWVIDFAPGSEWPTVDHHSTEERYFVLSGEIIDGAARYGAGTYVMFEAGSEHRPRSESGGRMLGINQA